VANGLAAGDRGCDDRVMLTVDRLSAHATFSDLSPDVLTAVADRAQELVYEAGAEVVGADDNAYHLFVVEEGTVEVIGADGPLAELGPGDFFGEIGLLVTGKRTAFVVAASPLRLIVLFDRDVRELQREHPELETQLRAALAERLPRR
jgi:CPA1 family monovalent cation:H+ antiporter